MTGPIHLPMGLMWNMPVPVACSLAVAAEGIAATCGQCPSMTRAGCSRPGMQQLRQR